MVFFRVIVSIILLLSPFSFTLLIYPSHSPFSVSFSFTAVGTIKEWRNWSFIHSIRTLLSHSVSSGEWVSEWVSRVVFWTFHSFSFTLLRFAVLSGFGGQSLFPSPVRLSRCFAFLIHPSHSPFSSTHQVIAVFNVFFTGLPIMVLAVCPSPSHSPFSFTHQVLDQDCSEVSVVRFPKLYKAGQERRDFNNRYF